MTNPFDPQGTSGAPVGTVGAPTGFYDNFEAVLQQASRNERWLGFEDEVQSSWKNSIAQLELRQGAKLPANNPLPMVEEIIDPNNERWITRMFLGLDDQSPERQAQFQAARDINEQLKAAKLPALEDIIEEVKRRREGRDEDTAAIIEASSGASGFLGRLAGGIVGAISDPAQLPTLAAGGVGKTVAMRIATEMGVNAAAGGFIQSQLSNPQHRLLGEQEGSVAEAALYGGLAAGVIRGGVEGLGVLGRRALERATPGDISFGFEDAQLRSMFEAAPENPSARAGLHLLDEQDHFDSANTHVDTDAGLRRFTGEVDEIIGSYTNTSTAVGRFLPDIEDFNIENLDYHVEVVRDKQPELFTELEAATARVNSLDEELAQVQNQLDTLTVGDAVRQLDDQAGELVRGYEAELAQPNLSAKQRSALEQKIAQVVESMQAVPGLDEAEGRLAAATTDAERIAAAQELDQLYRSVGEDPLGKALERVEIPLKKKLQSLRASRKAAAKEFRAVRNAMDQAVKRVQAEEAAKRQIAAALAGNERPAVDVETMRPDRVEAQAAQVEAAIEALPARLDEPTEALVKRANEAPEREGEAPINEPLRKDDMIDLGNGVLVDPSFKMTNELGEETTAGKVFKEMQEDEALLEAMRICSL